MESNSDLAACHNESQTPETGAGGKESSLFKCQPPEKMGDSLSQRPSPHLSTGRGFCKEGEGKAEERDPGRGMRVLC